jgi:nucleotide-binding universal stress UspA family protein
MIALKQILVPTDFSPPSDAAVRYGVAFAHAFQAQLHLFHVAVRHDIDIIVERQRIIETFLSGRAAAASQVDADELAEHAARALLGKILNEEDVSALRVEYVLRATGIGGPYVEIVRYAHEREIDLIVMGTHGRGFMGHLLMGSVAEKVVRKAPCPVLTVRHPEHEVVLGAEGKRDEA